MDRRQASRLMCNVCFVATEGSSEVEAGLSQCTVEIMYR